MRCGLLGRKLGHSYSPQIHAHLGDYPYDLFEKEPEDVEEFLRNGDFSAINVTIPYKQTVMPFCAELSPMARRIGAVNTIVRRKDGSLMGHNTDYFGFLSTVRRTGLDPAGKKALIIGSGGASKPAIAVLEELKANVVVISHKENVPENLAMHSDCAILVNATPVGMYPKVGDSPVDLSLFPRLEGVIDMIYNPSRTKLLLDAEARGLVAENGLWMLVAQAKEASEWFTGHAISDDVIAAIHRQLKREMENIILIGMPGCGKSTVGKLLAQKLNKPFVDADSQIEAAAGMTIPEIFADSEETGFRQIETMVLSELGKQSGLSWRFTNEKWMESLEWWSNGKVRFGWGQTGNSNIGGYAWGSSISPMDSALGAGYRPANIANTAVQWETQEQWNLGFDLDSSRTD